MATGAKGERKPGNPELDAWRDITANLPRA